MPSGKITLRALASFLRDLPGLWRQRLTQEENISQAHLRRALTAAEASTKAKNAFLASISHDLRTPINGITGLSWLLLDTSLSEEQRDYALRIRNSAETMLRLLNEVMDYSRLEAQRLELKTEAFPLATPLRAVVDDLNFSATKRGLRLSYRMPADLPTIFLGDAARLQQVLTILVDNAIKFTERGEITLTVAPAPNSSQLRFTVTDTSTSPQVREKIFATLAQMDSPSSHQAGGPALSLTVGKKILALMGGTLGFTALPTGGASTWFTLPLLAAPQPEAKILPFRRESPAAGDLRILVVEDNKTNCMVLGKMLEHLGHRWVAAENGLAALDNLEQDPQFDLILVDGHMPVMDGKEFTRSLRRHGNPALAHQRVIIISADAIAGSREAYLTAGADDYLAKPVTLAGLAQVIEKSSAQKKPA